MSEYKSDKMQKTINKCDKTQNIKIQNATQHQGDKQQIRQITKSQSPNMTKFKRTKYKCDRMQKRQNTNLTIYKKTKYKYDITKKDTKRI